MDIVNLLLPTRSLPGVVVAISFIYKVRRQIGKIHKIPTRPQAYADGVLRRRGSCKARLETGLPVIDVSINQWLIRTYGPIIAALVTACLAPLTELAAFQHPGAVRVHEQQVSGGKHDQVDGLVSEATCSVSKGND